MLASEFGTGQVFWSILWFFLFFAWISLVLSIFVDLVRNPNMSGWAKALWTFAILFLPFLGVLIYLIVNGGGMEDRSAKEAMQQQEAFDDYIRNVAGTSSATSELSALAALHDSGKLSDSEFAAAKAKLISG